MQIAVIVLIVLCCVLLVLFVLAQNSKGGASTLGASSGGQVMGAKKTTDLLEKLTWGFAIGLIVLCVAMNVVFLDTDSAETDVNLKVAQENAGGIDEASEGDVEMSADSAN